jgi:hypothetical protein
MLKIKLLVGVISMTYGVIQYDIFSSLVELGKNWGALAIISLSLLLVGMPTGCLGKTPI